MRICWKRRLGGIAALFLREAVADEVCRIVDMLSRITEPNALEDVSLNGASPPPLPMEEVVEG